MVSTTLPLPTVTIEHIPISVDCDVPAFGSVKSLLPLGYSVENRTAFLQDVEITLEPNDNFMFAGNKQVSEKWMSDFVRGRDLEVAVWPSHVVSCEIRCMKPCVFLGGGVIFRRNGWGLFKLIKVIDFSGQRYGTNVLSSLGCISVLLCLHSILALIPFSIEYVIICNITLGKACQ